VIASLEKAYSQASNKTESRITVLNILQDLSENEHINNKETMGEIESMLDDVLNLDDKSTILTQEEAKLSAEIVDQLLVYLDQNCEDKDTDLYKEM